MKFPLSSFISLPCLWLATWVIPLTAEESPPAEPAEIERLLAVQKLASEGKLAEAEEALRAAIREPGVEPGHPAIAKLQMHLAELCRQRGKHDEAFTAAAVAVPIFEKAMGAENPFSLITRWLAASEALAANRPADSAGYASPLFETLREYVTSGRAAAAQWEDTPQLREFLATMPPLNEVGIASVAALLGRAWAAAGEVEKALPILRDAAQRLERLHGPGQPELVEVSEVIEKIEAKRGEAVGRRYVGSLGFIRNLTFEGNASYPPAKLHDALAKDVAVVLASHPAADFADFLPVISRQLRLGYRCGGFPEATVEAVFDATREGGRIVVRIHEGPRVRMGEIRIEGAKSLDPAKLRDKLLDTSDKLPAPTLVGMVRKIMTAQASLLPQPETPDETVEALNAQIPTAKIQIGAGNIAPDAAENTPAKFTSLLNSSTKPTAPWKPGEPVSFKEGEPQPLLESVRFQLAELGHPLARFQTAYVMRDNGIADLVIRLEDEGPQAVTGHIKVTGCELHTAEEVIAAAGLKSGQPLVPELLDEALVALWNTGRFFPCAVTPEPRKDGSREIDLSIQVRELAGAPHLNDPIPPEQEAARSFICKLNEWIATGEFTDFVIASNAANADDFLFGLSASDGLVAHFGANGNQYAASLASGDLRGKLSVDGKAMFLRLPLPTNHVRPEISLLPAAANDGSLTIGAALGFSSSLQSNGRLPIQLAISPAMPFLEPDHFRREDDQVVISRKDGPEVFRLDIATALPVTSESARVEFRNGVVRDQQQRLAAEMAKLDDREGIQSWLGAANSLLHLMAGENGEHRVDFKTWDRWLQLASSLVKPGTLEPFSKLWTQWTAGQSGNDSFFIPVDLEQFQQVGTMNLLVGFGAVTLSEMLAPPDSWVSKLGREMVFFQGGKTQYTARTLQELLADPAIGPVGCQLTAQLLGHYDGAVATRFLEKALTQATAEGFRNDWRLLLNSPLGLGKAIEDALTALATLPGEDETAVAAVLEPDQAAWFHGFLTRLRERPAGQNLVTWITPQMDALWDGVLGEPIRRQLNALLHPAVDPQEVIAVVNGQQIPRAWIRVLEQSYPGSINESLPPMPPDPARAWTQRPALAEAIRMSLLAPFAKNLDPAKLDEVIEQLTADKAAKLTTDTDAEWIAACGVTRRQSGIMGIQLQQMASVLQSLAAKIPDPDPAELARWWAENAAKIGRQGHVHTIRATAAGSSVAQVAQVTGLVSEATALLRGGLPFSLLSGAAATDEECGLAADCTKDLLVMDLKPAFARSLVALKPGETSGVVQAGTARWAAMLVAWNDTPPPKLDDARDQIVELWRAAQLEKAVGRHLQPLEQAASIQLIDEPAIPAAVATPTVFERMAESSPGSPVAGLCRLWQLAQANDPRAAAALDEFLAGRPLSATVRGTLADALRAHGHPELADRCK